MHPVESIAPVAFIIDEVGCATRLIHVVELIEGGIGGVKVESAQVDDTNSTNDVGVGGNIEGIVCYGNVGFEVHPGKNVTTGPGEELDDRAIRHAIRGNIREDVLRIPNNNRCVDTTRIVEMYAGDLVGVGTVDVHVGLVGISSSSVGFESESFDMDTTSFNGKHYIC